MEPAATVAIVSAAVSIVSVIVSIVSIVFAVKANTRANYLSEKSNDVGEAGNLSAQASLHLEYRRAIQQVRQRSEAVMLAVAAMQAGSHGDLPASYLSAAANVVQAIDEDLRNIYEEACGAYLDNKVDKVRFQKAFRTEIRQIVEDEAHKEHFSDTHCVHRAMLNVYKEWNHSE